MSFDELYDAYWKELYAIAYRKLRNREDVEDILQDIFLSIAERHEVLDRPGSIRYYLHRSLRNKIIDFYRKVSVKEDFEVAWGWLFDESETARTDSQLICEDIARLVRERVSELPARMRLVHRMSQEEYLDHAEIAKRLGISVQTVKNQLGVALRHVRMALEEYRTYSTIAGIYFSYFFFG